MSSSGNFATGSYGNEDLYFEWWTNHKGSSTENYTDIGWQLSTRCGGSNYYVYNIYVNVAGNETTVGSAHVRDGVVASGTARISHDSEGKASFSAYAEAGIYTNAVNVSGSGNWDLDQIPRYLSITSLAVQSKTINSCVISWAVSNARDATYYSLNDGDWIGSATYGESVASDSKSGKFNIPNLSPGTSYTLKIKCKRTDSGLWTESGKITVSTYDIARITRADDVNIGNKPYMEYSNPSGQYIKSYLLNIVNGKEESELCGMEVITGTTSHQFSPSSSTMYSKIPNSNYGIMQYVLITVCNGVEYWSTSNNKYYVTNSNPVCGSFKYQDVNSPVVNITGDNQQIVNQQSSLRFIIASATAKNYATISNYSITFNGITKSSSTSGNIDYGKISATYSITATLTVTDSRGNQAQTTCKVTIVSWNNPSALITLKRLNNYEDETYLTVDGSFASVNSKNAMTIQYAYKQSDATTYSAFTTINDNVKQTLSLSKTKAWNFEIIVSDKFSTVTYYATLAKGMPILFLDTALLSVGVNCFPSHSKSFEVEGSMFVNDLEVLGFQVVDTW